MTEKRFHFGYVLGDTGLIDEQAEHKWFIENCCNITDLKKNWKTVCDKLNEVNDENEQLKKILGFLQNDNVSDIVDVLNYQENQMWKFQKENEQLKQQLQSILKLTRKIEDCIHDIKVIGDFE